MYGNKTILCYAQCREIERKNGIVYLTKQKTDLRTDSTILTYNNDDDNDDILKLTFDVKTCSLLPYNGYVVVVE